MIKKSKNLVLSNIKNNVGYIIFNRPEHLNTFNLDLANQFIHIIKSFSKNDTVRVIVIKGAGRVFSAGGDIKEMHNDVQKDKDRAAYFRLPLSAFNKMILTIRNTPKPVLTAVHGSVAGVAFNLMLSSDLRIAKEGTQFTQAFIRIGLSPDGGGTYFLPRLIGYARACELTMLPTIIDSEKALNWGLINWIVPANTYEHDVRKIAERLSDGPTTAIGRTKLLINQSFDRSLSEQMETERLAQIENASIDDFKEGLNAFIKKRQPKFKKSK